LSGLPDRTPIIKEVNTGGTGCGGIAGGPCVIGHGIPILITSMAGTTIETVPNPDFDPLSPEDASNPSTISRDFGFGSIPGTVTLDVSGTLIPLPPVAAWTPGVVTVTLPGPLPPDSTGELIVTRGDSGLSTVMGVTLTVNPTPLTVFQVPPGGSIQAVIDNPLTVAGSLVLVPPGEYFENLIISKPIRLQGYGAASTTINAGRFADNKAAWLTTLGNILPTITPLPGQRLDLNLEDGAGITVFGLAGANDAANNVRIDGFTIKGAIQGGGVFVNGHAPFTQISNNRFESNQGSFGGGVRVGWPALVNAAETGYVDAMNDDINIHHNQFYKNGSMDDGGGVYFGKGADRYRVTENNFCGNLATLNGGAVGHRGLSDNGLIADNKITFNVGWGEGGAIMLSGTFVPANAPVGTMTEGSGSVIVDSNLIQGNFALDDAGGISVFSASGQDTLPGGPATYSIKLLNNMIINNVSGFIAGGIALSDTVGIQIINNTIVHNDSTSTALGAGGALTTVPPKGAGIVTRPNSPLLAAETGEVFANPVLLNNIIWHNRAYSWDPAANGGLGDLVFDFYWDLQVDGVPGAAMDPRNSILSSLVEPVTGVTYHGSNIAPAIPASSLFVKPYLNTLLPPATANAVANFITFEPLTTSELLTPGTYPGTYAAYDYHILDFSAAVNRGASITGLGIPELLADYDDQIRPNPPEDIGADEIPGGTIDGNNYPPTISSLPVTTCDATPTTYTYQVIAVDPEGVTLGYSLPTAPGGMGIGPTTGLITWNGCALGPDFNVTVEVTDGVNTPPATQTFTITPSLGIPNDQPLAGGDTYITTEGTTLIIDAAHGVLINDSDPDNQPVPLVAALISGPTGATLTCPGGGILCADGSFNFTADAPGTYTFTYAAFDGADNSNEATVTIFVGAIPTASGVLVQCPAPLIPEGLAEYVGQTEDPNVVCIHLTAGDGFVKMGDGYDQYMFGFKDVTYIPDDQVMTAGAFGAELVAPTIVVKEHQKLYLTVTNVGMQIRFDLFDPHTVHWHGFPDASAIFDGVPNASVSMNPFHSFTYFYNAYEPGTYIYHCHVEATEHMQMGMYGNIWIEPSQNNTTPGAMLNGHEHQEGDKYAYNDGDGSTHYDVEVPIQLNGFDPIFHDASWTVQPLPFADMVDTYPMINGRGYPDTVNTGDIINLRGNPSQKVNSLITAAQGEKILLRITNLSIIDYFTLRTLGIPMKVIAKGARLMRSTSGENLFYNTHSLDIGGGEAFDVILDTAGIPVGTYFLYTTNMNNLNNNEEEFGGAMTEIIVTAP
jgi:plastocyanin